MSRWPWILKHGLPATAAGLLVSACAGGFGTDETQTRIITDPAVAQCRLEGHNFSATVQTPARVTLPKEAAPITLTCNAAKHHPFVTKLKPRFNNKVFANLLLGSLTGLIVDVANGHETKYPERIHVHMEPSAFATVEARDRWFARYRRYVAWKWDRIDAEVTDACQADEGGYDCTTRRNTVAAKRAIELQALEMRRRGAHIDASSTAERPVATAPPE